jgi:hypothetical protein
MLLPGSYKESNMGVEDVLDLRKSLIQRMDDIDKQPNTNRAYWVWTRKQT